MQVLEKILEEIEIRAIKDLEEENDRCSTTCEGCCSDVKGRKCNCRDAIIVRAFKKLAKCMNDGWIPVDKNNVPDHEILACDRYKNELIGYLSYNADSEEFVCESDECIMYQVIAWMEKPEPYRPERSVGE